MNNHWAFLPLEPANALLSDASALRQRFLEDGFLYLKGVMDRKRLLDVRRDILRICAGNGWVKDGAALMKARVQAEPAREGDERFFAVYDAVQKLESFHALAHESTLLESVSAALGGDVFPHPLKVARLIFPANYEVTTPPHQDYLNNQGSPDLTAAWMPLSDCPMTLGGLAVLKGSHRYGVMPLRFHLGAGNRTAILPPEMQHLRWYSADFELGDVLLFQALTLHASLHNASEFFMRLSVDFRYQREGDALTDICLQPHFQRLSWDDIYAGWQSKRYQYYWRQHAYRLEPFDRRPHDAAGLQLDDLKAYEDWQRKITHRYNTQRLHDAEN